MYAYKGTFTHRFGEEKVLLEEGDLLVMNQYVEHCVVESGEENIGINIIAVPEFFEKPFVLVLLRKVVEGKVHLLIFVVAVVVVVAGVVFFFHVAQFLHKLNGWVVFAGIAFLAWSHNEFLQSHAVGRQLDGKIVHFAFAHINIFGGIAHHGEVGAEEIHLYRYVKPTVGICLCAGA